MTTRFPRKRRGPAETEPLLEHVPVVRWWRERDSNPRPLGYEPNELPLLHPAMQAPF